MVDAEIARQLERELEAACAACATLAGLCEVKAIDPKETEPHKQHIEQGFRILEAVRAASKVECDRLRIERDTARTELFKLHEEFANLEQRLRKVRRGA